MKQKILITVPWKREDITEIDRMLETIEKKGYEADLRLELEHMSEDRLIEEWKGVHAHVCGTDFMTRKAMENAPTLRMISRIGVGIETVDIEAAADCGILVTNTPGAGAETVAEFAFMLMISVARCLVSGYRTINSGKWEHKHGHSLYRKTLGLVGMGNIGRMLAKIVSGFDMKIVAYDPYPDPIYAKEHNIMLCSNLDELLSQSDFISLHVPKNKHTLNLISERELKLMKNTAILINTSRGGIVNEKDLYTACKEGWIAGAGLDVLEKEPMLDKSNPILSLENLLVMPHNAGSSYDGRNRVIWAAINNVLDFFEDRPLDKVSVKNPQVFEKLKRVW